MQFPESWLREFCNPPLTSQQLADLLTMSGMEVEELRPVAPPFADIVVAEIVEDYRERRNALVDGLDQAGWKIEKPLGTMFVWAPLPERYAALGSLEFSKLVLEKADVAVAPGIGFGPAGEGFVRFALVDRKSVV